MPTSGDEPCSAASPSSESCGDDAAPLHAGADPHAPGPGVDGGLLELADVDEERVLERRRSASALWPVACGATRSPFSRA